MSANRSRRLHVLPDLGPYQIHAGALTKAHLGATVIVRRGRSVLIGPLTSVQDSITKPRKTIQVGDHTGNYGPTQLLTVVPEAFDATITLTAAEEGPTSCRPRGSVKSSRSSASTGFGSDPGEERVVESRGRPSLPVTAAPASTHKQPRLTEPKE